MAICETVAIEDGNGGFLVINKSDFNEKLHKVYGENEPDTKPVAPKKAAK